MLSRATTASSADIAQGVSTANQLNQFRQQVAELESGSEGLKAVLPEQKDVADPPRPSRRRHAVEPDDPRIQAGAVGDQAAPCGMADRAAARRHLSQPRERSSTASASLADHQR